MSDQHFEWFSILISWNWYSRQACSFALGIMLSTQNRIILDLPFGFPRNNIISLGLRIKSEKFHRAGEAELFSFFEGLSCGCWHLDWFSILISRNWRARQACFLTFGITLRTEQGCA